MRLALKKAAGYALWPFVWFVFGVYRYVAAVKPAWREYRFQTEGAFADFKRGTNFIRNYKGKGAAMSVNRGSVERFFPILARTGDRATACLDSGLTAQELLAGLGGSEAFSRRYVEALESWRAARAEEFAASAAGVRL